MQYAPISLAPSPGRRVVVFAPWGPEGMAPADASGDHSPVMTLIELGLSILVLILAFVYPNLGTRWFGVAEQKLGALARRRRLAVVLVGFLALAARVVVLPILPVPQPRVDDEFSYLLAADTFAHGRLTNPTPPMWQHFVTLAELVRPTYQSMAPPAQGMVLAFGEAVARQPFVGVWLSVGAMCAAICWMLQAWVGPEWALLGGLLAVGRFGIFSYWADSYWGGAVAAFGGALVLGALPRIFQAKRSRDALLMGIGLAILANSRPYEGLVFSLPVAVALLAWLIKRSGVELHVAIRRVLLPLVAALLLAGAGTSYYFWRVTGDPFAMPHQYYNARYDPVPPFIGLPLGKIPALRNPAMRHVYLSYELSIYRLSRSLPGLLTIWFSKAGRMWIFFLGPILSLPLILAPFTLPYGLSLSSLGWKSRFLLWSSLISLAGLAVELYGGPHYAAPMTCLLLAVVLAALKTVRSWSWRGKPSGLFVGRGVFVVCLMMLAIRASAGPLGISVKPTTYPGWYSSNPTPPAISRVRAEVEQLPGRQLVIVRYGSYFGRFSPLEEPSEWAFNTPNITQQKVVWADDQGPAENEKLIRYFKGRRPWLLNLGNWPPRLSPYLGAQKQYRTVETHANHYYSITKRHSENIVLGIVHVNTMSREARMAGQHHLNAFSGFPLRVFPSRSPSYLEIANAF